MLTTARLRRVLPAVQDEVTQRKVEALLVQAAPVRRHLLAPIVEQAQTNFTSGDGGWRKQARYKGAEPRRRAIHPHTAAGLDIEDGLSSRRT